MLSTVNENLWKEALSAKADCLLRTAVMWKGWDAAGPKPHYSLSWPICSPLKSHFLPTSVLDVTSHG